MVEGEMPSKLADILAEIVLERGRQDEQWGEQNRTDSRWLDILVEEVGEAAKALNQGQPIEGELIQIAAVAVVWLECVKRRDDEETRTVDT